jgi:Mn-dependent DtxR family transcriptional regulator
MILAAAPRRRDRPVRGVTTEQRRTLRIIAGLTLLHDTSPAISELARVLRVSKPAAFYRLHWLEKKGLWCRASRTLTESGLSASGLLTVLAQPPSR